MKKLVIALLASAFAVCLAFGIAACVPDIPDHNFDERWSSNETIHWHRCTDPGCTKRSEEAAHEFDYSAHVEYEGFPYVAPTCGETGKGNFRCTVCNALITNVVIPATGEHEWHKSSRLSIPATCGEDGKDVYLCTVCPEQKEEVVPATGEHEWVKVKDGAGHDTDADRWYSDINGHWHECSVCAQKGEIVPHEPGELIHEKLPQNKVDGRDVVKCEVCEFVVEDIPVLDENVPFSCSIRVTPKIGDTFVLTPPEKGVIQQHDVQIDNAKETLQLSFTDFKDKDGNSIASTAAVANVKFELYYEDRDGLKILSGQGGVTGIISYYLEEGNAGGRLAINPSIREQVLRFRLKMYTGSEQNGNKMYRGEGVQFELNIKKAAN